MPNPTGRRNVAVKVSEDVHAQLSLLAQLDGCQVPDVIRQAVTDYLDRKRAELVERQADLVAAIERQAEVQRAAVAALVAPAGEQPKLEVVGSPPKARGRRGSGDAEPRG